MIYDSRSVASNHINQLMKPWFRCVKLVFFVYQVYCQSYDKRCACFKCECFRIWNIFKISFESIQQRLFFNRKGYLSVKNMISSHFNPEQLRSVLLVTYYLLLFSCYWLFLRINPDSLVLTLKTLLVFCYSSIVTCYFSLVAGYYLLVTFYYSTLQNLTLLLSKSQNITIRQ